MTSVGEKIVPSICWSCHSRCGILNHVRDGKVVKVIGNPEYPSNKGYICIKGQKAWKELLYDPTRVIFPQKRAGERGEGKWQRISWDEALDIITEEFHKVIVKYGQKAICGATNNTTFPYTPATVLLMRTLGSPNFMINQDICHGAQSINDRITFGEELNFHYQGDYPNAKTIVVAAHNLSESYPPEFNAIMQAKKKGAKLIVIDPRRTTLAKKADLWLQINPGTDAALALGMLNVIISEELYDKEFVEDWTNGPCLVRMDTRELLRESDVVSGGNPSNFVIWDIEANEPRAHEKSKIQWPAKPALKGSYSIKLLDGAEVICNTAWELLEERAREFPTGTVARITGISEDNIKTAARMIATNKPTTLRANRFETNTTNVVTARLFSILGTIIGYVDSPGGNSLPKLPEGMKTQRQLLSMEEFKLPEEVSWKRIGARDYPLWCGADNWSYQTSHNPSVIDAILTSEPYPVRALYTSGYNHLMTLPGCEKNLKAYLSLDSHVCCTHNMTPTAQIADVVLPKTYEWEEQAICFHKGAWCGVVGIMPKVVEPPGECWDDWKIAHEIGKRMVEKGYVKKNFVPWKNSRELSDYLLEDTGITFEEAKKKGFIKSPVRYFEYKGKGFDTPSGKVEIYSSLLEKYGYDPLGHYEELPDNEDAKPSLAAHYPLILHTGLRDIVYHQARFRNHKCARSLTPDPELEMHPKDAEERGIKNGDWLLIETPGASRKITMKAKISDDAYPKYVMTAPSWWYPEEHSREGWFRSNINAAMDYGPPYDKIVGSPNVRHVRCQVTRATEA